MKKRWLCGTMAVVIGAMAMAGCSGGNSSSSASAAGTEAADSGSSVDTSGAEMTIRAAGIEYAGKWQKACKGILAGTDDDGIS